MELQNNKNALDKYFTVYEDIQVNHLNSMTNESLPDLVTMTKERETAFNNLKTHLDDFVASAGSVGGDTSILLLTELETRLNKIMLIDDELAEKIKNHRNRLKANLKHMKHGKTAMEGYKHANSVARKPFVFSINE